MEAFFQEQQSSAECKEAVAKHGSRGAGQTSR